MRAGVGADGALAGALGTGSSSGICGQAVERGVEEDVAVRRVVCEVVERSVPRGDDGDGADDGAAVLDGREVVFPAEGLEMLLHYG